MLWATARLADGPIFRTNNSNVSTWGIATSPNKRQFAVSANNWRITVWTFEEDFSIATPSFELIGHSYNVPSICFSSDGRFITSTSIDGKVMLWELATRKCVFCTHTFKKEWGWSCLSIDKNSVQREDSVLSYARTLHSSFSIFSDLMPMYQEAIESLDQLFDFRLLLGYNENDLAGWEMGSGLPPPRFQNRYMQIEHNPPSSAVNEDALDVSEPGHEATENDEDVASGMLMSSNDEANSPYSDHLANGSASGDSVHLSETAEAEVANLNIISQNNNERMHTDAENGTDTDSIVSDDDDSLIGAVNETDDNEDEDDFDDEDEDDFDDEDDDDDFDDEDEDDFDDENDNNTSETDGSDRIDQRYPKNAILSDKIDLDDVLMCFSTTSLTIYQTNSHQNSIQQDLIVTNAIRRSYSVDQRLYFRFRFYLENFDRLCISTWIPELSCVFVATQAGTAALYAVMSIKNSTGIKHILSGVSTETTANPLNDHSKNEMSDTLQNPLPFVDFEAATTAADSDVTLSADLPTNNNRRFVTVPLCAFPTFLSNCAPNLSLSGTTIRRVYDEKTKRLLCIHLFMIYASGEYFCFEIRFPTKHEQAHESFL